MADPQKDEAIDVSPAGDGDWLVEAGQGVDAIADATGHFWRTIWEAPENAALKAVRENRNRLLPGDRVTAPALRPASKTRSVDMVHRFKRKGVPARIRLRAKLRDGAVLADADYTLQVGKRRYSGKTDGDGLVDAWVAPSAKTGLLSVAIDKVGYPERAEWTLRIGALAPLASHAGVQGRLNNLGFAAGPEDGVPRDEYREAVRRFQRAAELPETGFVDQATLDALAQRSGEA